MRELDVCLCLTVLTPPHPVMAEGGSQTRPDLLTPYPWHRLVVLPNEDKAWLGPSVLFGASGQS